MVTRHPFIVLAGGRTAGEPTTEPPRPRHLRLIPGGCHPELDVALAEAVQAARQMRLEIERRIAQALEAFGDGA